MSHMIMELMGHKDCVRVLLALRKGPLRFSQIQKSLRLNPAQADRALKFLRKDLWIIPRTLPTEGDRVLVEYTLGKRGAAFLVAFDSFRGAARKQSAQLGPSEIEELQRL